MCCPRTHTDNYIHHTSNTIQTDALLRAVYLTGEFGIVYKAELQSEEGSGQHRIVAVKTLKGVGLTPLVTNCSVRTLTNM